MKERKNNRTLISFLLKVTISEVCSAALKRRKAEKTEQKIKTAAEAEAVEEAASTSHRHSPHSRQSP